MEALAVLASKEPAIIGPSFFVDWTRLSDDLFEPSNREAWTALHSVECWPDLMVLNSYTEFAEALESNELTAGQLENLVGTPWEQVRISGELIFRGAVMSAVTAARSYEVDRDDIYAGALSQVERLATDVVRQFGIVQFVGVTCGDEAIEFADGVVFRRLTDEEIGVLLRHQLFARPTTWPPPLTVDPFQRHVPVDCQYGMVVSYDHKKLVGERHSTPEAPVVMSSVVSKAEALLTAIRLTYLADVSIGSQVSFVGSEAIGLSGLSYAPTRPMARSGTVEITDNASDLRRLVESISDETVSESPLRIALARFRDTPLRATDEDKLIDLTIALEALFNDSEVEVAHKLAMRAAMYARMPKVSPSLVFRFTKSAYVARSRIVHGKKLPKLRLIDGSNTDRLAEVVDDVATLVATGLLRAVHDVRSEATMIDWSEFERTLLDSIAGTEEE